MELALHFLQTGLQARFDVTIPGYSSNMAVNNELFDGDAEDDPFQALERDDDPIVWETSPSLRREQFRVYIDKQDELERERIADFVDADVELLRLLHRHKYDDEGFLENLDPELWGTLDEDDEVDEGDVGLMEYVEDVPDDKSPENFEDDDVANPDEDDAEKDNVTVQAIADASEPVTKLAAVEFKVDVLERLAALRRCGDLTENEFESLKGELLRKPE